MTRVWCFPQRRTLFYVPRNSSMPKTIEHISMRKEVKTNKETKTQQEYPKRFLCSKSGATSFQLIPAAYPEGNFFENHRSYQKHQLMSIQLYIMKDTITDSSCCKIYKIPSIPPFSPFLRHLMSRKPYTQQTEHIGEVLILHQEVFLAASFCCMLKPDVVLYEVTGTTLEKMNKMTIQKRRSNSLHEIFSTFCFLSEFCLRNSV